MPTATFAPTASPTPVPTLSSFPTAAPTATPTAAPSVTPSAAPSGAPSPVPSAVPTAEPTAPPSPSPSQVPTPYYEPRSCCSGKQECEAGPPPWDGALGGYCGECDCGSCGDSGFYFGARCEEKHYVTTNYYIGWALAAATALAMAALFLGSGALAGWPARLSRRLQVSTLLQSRQGCSLLAPPGLGPGDAAQLIYGDARVHDGIYPLEPWLQVGGAGGAPGCKAVQQRIVLSSDHFGRGGRTGKVQLY